MLCLSICHKLYDCLLNCVLILLIRVTTFIKEFYDDNNDVFSLFGALSTSMDCCRVFDGGPYCFSTICLCWSLYRYENVPIWREIGLHNADSNAKHDLLFATAVRVVSFAPFSFVFCVMVTGGRPRLPRNSPDRLLCKSRVTKSVRSFALWLQSSRSINRSSPSQN